MLLKVLIAIIILIYYRVFIIYSKLKHLIV